MVCDAPVGVSACVLNVSSFIQLQVSKTGLFVVGIVVVGTVYVVLVEFGIISGILEAAGRPILAVF